MNRNIYLDGIWPVRVTPENYLNWLQKKQANTMLSVFMDVMYRCGHGFISLYHSIQLNGIYTH